MKFFRKWVNLSWSLFPSDFWTLLIRSQFHFRIIVGKGSFLVEKNQGSPWGVSSGLMKASFLFYTAQKLDHMNACWNKVCFFRKGIFFETFGRIDLSFEIALSIYWKKMSSWRNWVSLIKIISKSMFYRSTSFQL